MIEGFAVGEWIGPNATGDDPPAHYRHVAHELLTPGPESSPQYAAAVMWLCSFSNGKLLDTWTVRLATSKWINNRLAIDFGDLTRRLDSDHPCLAEAYLGRCSRGALVLACGMADHLPVQSLGSIVAGFDAYNTIALVRCFGFLGGVLPHDSDIEAVARGPLPRAAGYLTGRCADEANVARLYGGPYPAIPRQDSDR
jgi:hypothetical protein